MLVFLPLNLHNISEDINSVLNLGGGLRSQNTLAGNERSLNCRKLISPKQVTIDSHRLKESAAYNLSTTPLPLDTDAQNNSSLRRIIVSCTDTSKSSQDSYEGGPIDAHEKTYT